jgi:hypothetical protein
MAETPPPDDSLQPDSNRLPFAGPMALLDYSCRCTFTGRRPGTAERVMDAVLRFHKVHESLGRSLQSFLDDWDGLTDLVVDRSSLSLKLKPALQPEEVYAAIALIALEGAKKRLEELIAAGGSMADQVLDRMLENAIWANVSAQQAEVAAQELQRHQFLSDAAAVEQRALESAHKRDLSRLRWRERDQHKQMALRHASTLDARTRAAAARQLVIWLADELPPVRGKEFHYNTETVEAWLKDSGWTPNRKGASAP